MYLFLFLVFSFLCCFFMIKFLLDFFSDISNKKIVYSVKNSGDKYFLLSLFLSFSKPFELLLKKINLSFYNVYTHKLQNILKVLNYPFYEFTPYNFTVFQFLSMFSAMMVSFVVIGNDLFIACCIGLLFFILPYLKVVEEYKRIIKSITKQLPNFCDLLSVMLVSGIDFHNCIVKISNIIDGTLSNETKEILSKVRLGVDIKTAFNDMAQKYNIEQLNLFVRTINSALDSGLGMAQALDAISKQLKIEDAATAQKQAHEAPVKMLLPMTFLILPTIFILLFAPIILSFIKNGSIL